MYHKFKAVSYATGRLPQRLSFIQNENFHCMTTCKICKLENYLLFP